MVVLNKVSFHATTLLFFLLVKIVKNRFSPHSKTTRSLDRVVGRAQS